MSSISDAQKLEILYNKSFGLATSLPSGQLSALPGTSANNKIIPANTLLIKKKLQKKMLTKSNILSEKFGLTQ